MIDFLTDAVDNALRVVSDVFDPYATLDRRSVAKLIADGVTIAAIAVAFDVAEDVVRELAE